MIRNWARDKKRGIGRLTTSVMELTKFDDLTLRLGHPYLFMHQADCEHLIVISDIRMFNPKNDSALRQDYPMYNHIRRRVAVSCNLCKLNVGKWFTQNDDRVPHQPFFFCDNCYHSFCGDGKKVPPSAQSYRYLDRTAIA